ncbi:Reverse transcriptase (RNA-dependent DNA polymerase) [Fragilaria crotonensis]|nr:Reverse transcriptase (RNA-dependent DNA polymerase) [Fragilaria crotonensis]
MASDGHLSNVLTGQWTAEVLYLHCAGSVRKTSVKTRKNKAYASIASSNYRGIRKQFTFAQYVAIHQAAHNELEDCNEPIPETKKVSDFLAGISDSSLEAGITCVLSEDRYQDSFEATQQFLGTLVANQMIHRQAKRGGSDDRNVSSADSGSNKGHAKSKGGKKKLEARFYSAEEWKQLTSEERSKVIELKKQQGSKGKDKKGSSKRKAASAESTKDKDDEAAPSDGDEANETDATAQGGNEFGRGAHKKAKKKATISAVSSTAALPTPRAVRHVMMVSRRVVMDSSQFAVTGEGRMELDTHADTCVAGSNTVVLDLTGKVAVSPFCDSEFRALEDIPIATVATAYDCPSTGKTYILVINEALYFGDKMKHSLLCPNQLRAHGLKVHDCPRQYDSDSTHSIHIPESDLTIPLTLRGVISGFITRVPTTAELEDLARHVELTSDEEWEPYASAFSSAEEERDTYWKERFVLHLGDSKGEGADYDTSVELAIAESNDLADRLIASVRIDLVGDDPVRSAGAFELRSVEAVVRDGTRSVITPEDVAKRWNIGLSTATKTLQVTTQLGVRTLKYPAQRRFRTAMPHLRYPRLKGTFYADTLFFTMKSVRGFKCAHLIGNGLGFARFTPMELKSDAHLSLTSFIQQHGVMENLVVDNDPTMGVQRNRAELDVREIKRSIRRFTKRSGSPKRLWCFLGELVATLRGLTAYETPKLQGRCATEHALGYTPDISPWVQHAWYENVWYRDADGESRIGKWLGLATNIGGGDCFWILPLSARPIARSTVWSITRDELAGDAVRRAIESLDLSIRDKIGDSVEDGIAQENVGALPVNGDLLEDLDDDAAFDEEPGVPEMDEYTPETFDGYLTASVMLPRGDEVLKAQVVARRGTSMGINRQSQLESDFGYEEYVVEFEDGTSEVYAANMIAENMYAQVDKEGKAHTLISDIVDHESDERAMKVADGTFVDKQGRQRPRITTQGWRLLVEWKDGTTTWVPLKDLKSRSR